MENGEAFSRLMEEYGSLERQDEVDAAIDAKKEEDTNEPAGSTPSDRPFTQATQALMQEEERYTGAVSWSVYMRYFNYAGGFLVFPLVLLWIALVQGAQGACSTPTKPKLLDIERVEQSATPSSWDFGRRCLYLGSPKQTTSERMPRSALRVPSLRSPSVSLSGQFISSVYSSNDSDSADSLASLTAGLQMFKDAFSAVIRSPVSFFDTTPLGEILTVSYGVI